MIAKVQSYALSGLEGVCVTVEADISKGLPSYDMVGLPDTAVKAALQKLPQTEGELLLVAIGKAAWQMAKAAREVLAQRAIPLHGGIVITKYGHVMGPIDGILCREAGHPIPDENSFSATSAATPRAHAPATKLSRSASRTSAFFLDIARRTISALPSE